MKDHVRQGDVLLIAIDAIPQDAEEMERDADGSLTLLHGEATGINHRDSANQVNFATFKI